MIWSTKELLAIGWKFLWKMYWRKSQNTIGWFLCCFSWFFVFFKLRGVLKDFWQAAGSFSGKWALDWRQGHPGGESQPSPMPNSQSFTAHFNICETFFCSQTIKITQIDCESAMGLGIIGCDLIRSHWMGWQVPDHLILMMIVSSGSQLNKPSNVKTLNYIPS